MARRELHLELPSTQGRALSLARDGAEEGTVVVARRQTAGRGRLDHTWESPYGGLYLSVVLAGPGVGSPLLPLALGAGVAEALAREYGLGLQLKWPNDLVAVAADGSARKLGGILVDGVAGPRGPAAVAGIGLNVRPARAGLSQDVGAAAVGLEELSGSPVDLLRLEQGIVRAALEARKALAAPRPDASVVARCRRLLYGVGAAVTVDGAPAGRIVGLGEDGTLEVASGSGRRAIVAGEVRVRRAP